MLNITVVPLVLDAQCIVQWRLLWELSLCMKVASSRSGLLATTLVSKAALLSRPGRSHTRQAWHALSLWRRKKSRKQHLRHIEFSRQATLKKWLLPFFLNAPPLPYNVTHSSRTSLCGFRDRVLGTFPRDVAAVAAT